MSNIFDQMEADFESNLASSVEKLDQGDLTTVAGMARATGGTTRTDSPNSPAYSG